MDFTVDFVMVLVVGAAVVLRDAIFHVDAVLVTLVFAALLGGPAVSGFVAVWGGWWAAVSGAVVNVLAPRKTVHFVTTVFLAVVGVLTVVLSLFTAVLVIWNASVVALLGFSFATEVILWDALSITTLLIIRVATAIANTLIILELAVEGAFFFTARLVFGPTSSLAVCLSA